MIIVVVLQVRKLGFREIKLSKTHMAKLVKPRV